MSAVSRGSNGSNGTDGAHGEVGAAAFKRPGILAQLKEDRIGAAVPDGDYQTMLQLLETHIVHENAHDIDGILTTLTRDPMFVNEMLPFTISEKSWFTRKYWMGRQGAIEFYQAMFRDFADFHLDLLGYAVSPKGLVSYCNISGDVFAELLKLPKLGIDGIPFKMPLPTFFPFDSVERKFGGEQIYLCTSQAVKNLY